ncbi:RmlC-like cupin domain-containing protein [Biscogniauxia mediterranea]|nr:RmlC-like cupin domain-containing protein [Biscogniauxia mediterranea]
MLKPAVISAILALCAVSSAAPQLTATSLPPSSSITASQSSSSLASSSSSFSSSSSSSSPNSTTATAAASTTTTGVSPSPSDGGAATLAGLSKTQQILLSDLQSDAFNDVLTSDADFVFDFGAARKNGPGQGGEIVLANRKTFPALTRSGVAMALGFLGPCGFNTPHVHNRATELLVVTRGQVVSEMILENGAVSSSDDSSPRNIMNTLSELQATPFYPGALHSQFNPGCDDAVFVAPFSSDDPGVETMAQAYLALGPDTVRAAAGNQIDGADVDRFRGLLSENVALGVEACLRTCGIEKRK